MFNRVGLLAILVSLNPVMANEQVWYTCDQTPTQKPKYDGNCLTEVNKPGSDYPFYSRAQSIVVRGIVLRNRPDGQKITDIIIVLKNTQGYVFFAKTASYDERNGKFSIEIGPLSKDAEDGTYWICVQPLAFDTENGFRSLGRNEDALVPGIDVVPVYVGVNEDTKPSQPAPLKSPPP